MANSLFFNHVQKNKTNKDIIRNFEGYIEENPNEQIYLITAPLGEQKYQYDYENSALVILSPKHKIIFLDLKNDGDAFEEYYEDFMEDLSSLSDKYNYKQYIGRPRKWREDLTVRTNEVDSIDELLGKYKIEDPEKKRINNLLISLLIGSINDIEKIGAEIPETLLEKIQKNIILFDGDQTRFIYKNFSKKTVSIQGLSGTGKTELLLHKLKELYVNDDDSRIFFTCHNIALANTLKGRIPKFFDFMKVEKQIEWNKRLWVNRAWGSAKDKHSGLYSYICDFYDIPFLRYSYSTTYKTIFLQALEHIRKIDKSEFEYAFDYILIDERQDFPKGFFTLCEEITKNKIYIAGDIFQDIWDNASEKELEVDIVLNRCYRTDPKTLMFAHAIGMGLFEGKKFNWLSDKQWEEIGYKISKQNDGSICLSREPIRRFEELEAKDIPSIIIEKLDNISQIINILIKTKENNPTVKPDDIAIIILDENKGIYEFIDKLGYKIAESLGWDINRAYDTKTKIDDTIFVSNRNNVKGLEFPFVICITAKIKDEYRYRNSLYTMLTRSFIQSYLFVRNDDGLDAQQDGLKIINKDGCIKTNKPNKQEKEEIRQTIVKVRKEQMLSYDEFLNKLFNELETPEKCREKLKKGLVDFEIERFNEEQTKNYIRSNLDFCK